MSLFERIILIAWPHIKCTSKPQRYKNALDRLSLSYKFSSIRVLSNHVSRSRFQGRQQIILPFLIIRVLSIHGSWSRFQGRRKIILPFLIRVLLIPVSQMNWSMFQGRQTIQPFIFFFLDTMKVFNIFF